MNTKHNNTAPGPLVNTTMKRYSTFAGVATRPTWTTTAAAAPPSPRRGEEGGGGPQSRRPAEGAVRLCSHRSRKLELQSNPIREFFQAHREEEPPGEEGDGAV